MKNSDLVTAKEEYAVEPHPHPTSFIDDELSARGWTLIDLAECLAPMFPDLGAAGCKLMLDMYWVVGPADTRIQMGENMAVSFSSAFGISKEFFLNLETAWLKDAGATP